MKTIKILLPIFILIVFVACRDTKKEEQIFNAQMDSIEAVEFQLDETLEEIENKTQEVEDVLKELDSI